MSVKTLVFTLGYLLAWLVLMPIVAIGGGISLFLYALGAELTQLLTGRKELHPDPIAARAMAAKICMPYAARRASLSHRTL